MTELELLNHAKSYIDQLAKGIDPITGQTMERDITLNHVLLARCFFFVSEILEKVIENDGVVSSPKAPVTEKKLKFSITDEEIAQVSVTDTLVGITDFCERITDTVGNPKMHRLSTSKVTDWLVEKGFLNVVVGVDGKNKRLPTPIAEEVGIVTQERTNVRYGTYLATA